MGEYLTIIWESTAPAANAVQWDNSMLVVKGSEASLTETTIYACTSSDWSTILTNAGFTSSSQAYKSTANFFAASPTPGGNLYVLGLCSGAVTSYTDVPLVKVSSSIYETPHKPPLGFVGEEQVKYFPDANKTGYFVNKADGSAGMGFTVVDDEMGNWNGRLNFLSGLSGFTIDNPPKTGSKISCSFRIGGAVSDLGQFIDDFQISMMAASYANTKTLENYTDEQCYFGSQINDLSRFMGAIAGKNCLFFWALPGDAIPGDNATGFDDKWYNFRTFIGAREDFAPLKAAPSATKDDMAAGYMGMTAGEHPHSTLSFKPVHMGLDHAEDSISRSYWNYAQIASPMVRPELSGKPNLITHGFTLGTGYSARINYVRCKYIIAKELTNTLWALLASRKIRMSYTGMMQVKATIEGLFKRLQDQGIVDGLEKVDIPVANDLKANNAAGQAARAAREIPSITIDFYWYSSLEKITITGISNVA